MISLKENRVTGGIFTALICAAILFSLSIKAQAEEINKEQLQAMWDRQEITQVLYRNVRSIDRLDTKLMKSTYWPDAVQDHQDPLYPIDFSGNAWEFCDFAISELAKIERTNHRLSNVMIELHGDRAYAEAYVRAYHIMDQGGVKKEGILLGRYQNVMERRNGEWKILYRLTIFDANRSFDATETWVPNFRNLGARFPEDISYKIMEKAGAASKSPKPFRVPDTREHK